MLLNLCNLYLLLPSCPDPLAFCIYRYFFFFLSFTMQQGYNNYSQLFDWCGSIENWNWTCEPISRPLFLKSHVVRAQIAVNKSSPLLSGGWITRVNRALSIWQQNSFVFSWWGLYPDLSSPPSLVLPFSQNVDFQSVKILMDQGWRAEPKVACQHLSR